MNRSLSTAVALGLAAIATASGPAWSQGVFPPPPPPGQSGFVTGLEPQQRPAGPPPGAAMCNNFVKLRDDAATKASLVQSAGKRHADRQEMCTVVTRFVAAETLVVNFLEKNKTLCGVPDVAVSSSKANHAKSVEFREKVCAEGPKPKAPSLSEAIGTPSLDTRKNTKTGRGTLDTLTGNPLAQ